MNVIELNGNLYDALTGAYLRSATQMPQTQQAQATQMVTPPPTAFPLDPSKVPAVPATDQAPTPVVHLPVAAVPTVVKAVHHRNGSAASHIAAHKPQSTKTLMRHAVSAPKTKPRTPIKFQPNLSTSNAAASSITKAPTHHQTSIAGVTAANPQRNQRAMDINRSGMVRRFRPPPVRAAHPAAALPTPITSIARPAQQTPVLPVLPMAPPIKALQPQAFRPRPASIKPEKLAREKLARHGKFEAFEKLDKLEQAQPEAGQTQQAQQARPAEKDIFEQALAIANSHQQQAPQQSALQSSRRRKRSRRLASIMTSAVVFLLLIGAVAYQNRTSIQLQLASAKAGFAASAPGYKPEGFSIGKIAYGPGTISTTYNHDGKSFSVVQKKSNWDSQTLLENFVATSNESYQGYQSNGRTIYVYGTGRATWVNGGVWYQIQADNVLPNEQIVKVASSM
jgi:hypothetical protein